MKRLFDLFFCLLSIPFAIPICLAAALAVWIECRASPIFWQMRLGQHEVPFRLIKIRTMSVDTVQAASHEVEQQQILKVGRIIRATKIDELPQLWNVIIGNMSLVGPRPGLAMQRELTRARRHYKVFDLRPGITGISQISGIDMSTPWELAKMDANYNRNWCLKRDLIILYRTLIGKGIGDAATRKEERDKDSR